MNSLRKFIPCTETDIKRDRDKNVDIVIITSDSYIDHPYFDYVRTARYLQAKGFKVFLVDIFNFEKSYLLRPNLFFLVNSGLNDSMVQNYSPFLKYKNNDFLMPGGKRGERPNRAVIKITNFLKQHFKNIPVVITGNEASGRMITHYDFWSNKLRKPIIFDSKADLQIYGNSEITTFKLAAIIRSKKRFNLSDFKDLEGLCFISKELPLEKHINLPSHEEAIKDKDSFLNYNKEFYQNFNHKTSPLVQKVLNRYLIINKPFRSYEEHEMDEIYSIPYIKKPHYKYQEEIPFYSIIKDKIMTHNGNPEGNFIVPLKILRSHIVSSRSIKSILNENKKFSGLKIFNKIISNFASEKFNYYAPKYKNLNKCYYCTKISCFYPKRCNTLRFSSRDRIKLMTEIDNFPNLRNHFYGAPFNFNILLEDHEDLKDLIKNRTSKDFSVDIISLNKKSQAAMGLPYNRDDILHFYKYFVQKIKEFGKNYELKLEFTIGFPGDSIESIKDDINFLKENQIPIGRVNSYLPLPASVGSVEYYTEKNFFTGEALEVLKNNDIKHNIISKINFRKNKIVPK